MIALPLFSRLSTVFGIFLTLSGLLILWRCSGEAMLAPHLSSKPAMVGVNPEHENSFDVQPVATFAGLSWHVKINGIIGLPFSTPLVYQDFVVLACAASEDAAHFVLAVSAKDGKERWRFKTGAFIHRNLAIRDETVLVASDGLYAVNLQTGTLKWKSEIDGKLTCAPVLVADTVYVAGFSKESIDTLTGKYTKASTNLYAFNFQTGKEIWHMSLPSEGGSVVFPPAIHDTTAYISSVKLFYAVDLTKKEVKWRFKRPEPWIFFMPAIRDSLIFISGSTRDSTLYALTKQGKETWHFTSEGTPEIALALGDSLVYFGDENGNFYALNILDGKKNWQFKASKGLASPPVLVDKVIHFVCEDGWLFTLDAKSGKVLWKFQVDEKQSSCFGVSDQTIFLATRDSHLLAISADPRKVQEKRGSMLEIAPKSSAYYQRRGFEYFWDRRYDLSVLECDKAIRADSCNKQAFRHKAAALVEMDSLEQALVNFSRAISLDTTDAEEYVRRAGVHIKLKNYKAALQDCKTALWLEPKSLQASIYLSWAEQELGKKKIQSL